MKNFMQSIGGLLLVLIPIILIAFIWYPADWLRNILLTDISGILIILMIDKNS